MEWIKYIRLSEEDYLECLMHLEDIEKIKDISELKAQMRFVRHILLNDEEYNSED